MITWMPLSHDVLGPARYWPVNTYLHCARQSACPMVLAELSRLLPLYALGFLRLATGYQPVALLGMGHANVYVTAEGQWLGSYVPASLRGHPFAMATSENGQKQLCIDQSTLTEDPRALPLFADDGQLAPAVAQTWEFLQDVERNRMQTLMVTSMLAEAQLLQPWPLCIESADRSSRRPLDGLYRVDEAALNSLDPGAYAQLRGAPMALIHAQLFSTHQLGQLAIRADFLRSQTPQLPTDLQGWYEDPDTPPLLFEDWSN
jgi:hypothetical protein